MRSTNAYLAGNHLTMVMTFIRGCLCIYLGDLENIYLVIKAERNSSYSFKSVFLFVCISLSYTILFTLQSLLRSASAQHTDQLHQMLRKHLFYTYFSQHHVKILKHISSPSRNNIFFFFFFFLNKYLVAAGFCQSTCQGFDPPMDTKCLTPQPLPPPTSLGT